MGRGDKSTPHPNSSPRPGARSNTNGSSVWREVVSQLESDYKASPITLGEPDVVLSLSMVSQLKEELARDLRQVVREELWRPLEESSAERLAAAAREGGPPAPAADQRMCVGQLAVTAFHERLDKQRPREVDVQEPWGGAAEGALAQEGAEAHIQDDDLDEHVRQQKIKVLKRLNDPVEDLGGKSAATQPGEPGVWDIIMAKLPCCRPCLTRLRRAYRTLGNAESPPRSDLLSKFADSRLFETLVYVVILMNSVFMFYAAEMEVQHYDSDMPGILEIGELFFLTAYSIEFVVKIWRYHLYYFIDSRWKYNWLDCFLIVLSAYSIFLEDSLPNFSWLRMLRMLRLFKVVRVLRLISVVKPLRAILKSLYDTIGTLFWSLLLLALILALFALVLVLRVASYLQDEGDSLDELVEEDLLKNYGGIGMTFHHLFEATTGGNDWSIYFFPLVETGYINCGIFYFFVVFTQIAVLNIILGVFVDSAMKSMEGGYEERAQDFAEYQKQMQDDLTTMCKEIDGDDDGKLSMLEWQDAMNKDKFKNHLAVMECRNHEVKEYLNMMCNDTADGYIDIDVFVSACMRFKGAASCYDMQLVLHAVQDLTKQMKATGGRRSRLSSRSLSSAL